MNFPEIPNLQATTLERAVIDLLDSIAKEEEAISQLLMAEAKRNLTFTGEELDFPTKPSNDDIIEYCHSVNKIIETIFIKEWLLYEKLNKVLEIEENGIRRRASDEEKEVGVGEEIYLKTIENTFQSYHDSLSQVQQIASEYLGSIGKLFDGVQRKGSLPLQRNANKWLTRTVHQIIELQRLILQKNLLIKPKDDHLSIMNQRNMTRFHLKSTHSPQPWIATKNEPPLKPWLSEKVYRHY